MHLLNLEQELARSNDIVVELVQMSACRQLGAGDMGQRVEVKAVYGPQTKVYAYEGNGKPEAKQILHGDDVAGQVVEPTLQH